MTYVSWLEKPDPSTTMIEPGVAADVETETMALGFSVWVTPCAVGTRRNRPASVVEEARRTIAMKTVDPKGLPELQEPLFRSSRPPARASNAGFHPGTVFISARDNRA